MEPIELLALMTASLRAGAGGRSDAAWAKAAEEAVYGLSLILANEASIRAQLAKALTPAAASGDLVVPASGLVVPK